MLVVVSGENCWTLSCYGAATYGSMLLLTSFILHFLLVYIGLIDVAFYLMPFKKKRIVPDLISDLNINYLLNLLIN